MCFLQIDMSTVDNGSPLYTFQCSEEWTEAEKTDGWIIYAYGTSEMQIMMSGDSTSVLTEQMTMKSISNEEYASIDDINAIFTGYAIGEDEASTIPIEVKMYS